MVLTAVIIHSVQRTNAVQHKRNRLHVCAILIEDQSPAVQR